uniref:Uncharacterized protein n=1 Tax=Trichinella nativa TaxID=6335 RepID=A0A0V1KIJ8_9BILA
MTPFQLFLSALRRSVLPPIAHLYLASLGLWGTA